jgi:hypothetical protein
MGMGTNTEYLEKVQKLILEENGLKLKKIPEVVLALGREPIV